MTRYVGLVLVGVLIPTACADDGAEVETAGPRVQGGDEVGGQVVATVDGVGITIADVRSLMEDTGESPEAALARLVEIEVLAAEASRRGYGTSDETRITRARTLVQELLERRVEAVVTGESIGAEAIAARYSEQLERFVPPERRTSTHLLVEAGADASVAHAAEAEALANEVLAAASAPNADPAAVFEEFRARERPAELSVRVEVLPPFRRVGELDQAYADALFETPVGTLWPRVVRSAFGFHVILVTGSESTPGRSLEEASDEIRAELVVEGRAALLQRLLAELAESDAPEIRQDAFNRAAANVQVDS